MSEFMTEDEMLAMEGTAEEANVSYIPLPNTVDVVLSDLLAPDTVTPTAFVFPFFDNGDILLAHNRRRQVEVPGGHRDPIPPKGMTLAEALALPMLSFKALKKEHPVVAAKRETDEETGAVVSDVVAVGFMRSHSDGVKPDGYKYPWPNSCQQFFAGLIERVVPFEETDECRPPVRLTHEQAEQAFNGRTLTLYRAARAALFPQPVQHRLPTP
ncbi:NUDIX domain-containing protein [Rhizobium sp. BK176]|uniref:NUDIX domain-containing protein n=1 Tax=Rhizobium sp. BK176 TaxID=2587071 RepID=UPI0021691A0A|nr:NUDIX domain-containing protein [Rhizobium sp. BK176]MCS4088896.1 8-oxo-dGTP pyrophosphatase MutT (NUDIX family) [Rhizobium sp. BK176]